MRLKLNETPKRTLEIERPDGRMVILELKRIIMGEVGGIETETKKIDLEYAAGKIDTWEYYIKMISQVTVEFNPKDFDDLDLNHIISISNKIGDLQKNKPEEEKKSPAK